MQLFQKMDGVVKLSTAVNDRPLLSREETPQLVDPTQF
jgi:hypothetical protein